MSICRLLISCPDAHGLVAKVSQFIFEQGGNIKEAHHHLDDDNKLFFMRIEIDSMTLNCSIDELKKNFQKVAKTYQMSWRLSDASYQKRILIMGSKATHCVADLMHRDHEQELDGKIIGVLSNHNHLSKIAKWYEVPSVHIPVNQETKDDDLAKISNEIEKFNPDVIVLARYMQIIPEELCDKYREKIINIHHSFLPSFIGADPYQKASDRGVKLIGATCHYVTSNLDEGPIIEQDVIRVDHADSREDMKKMGQDVEKITLAKGLQYHLQDRVIVFNNKTIVFN
ncbi:MAG: formyltetrahydrofolate deformylase [Gammaproteobacteria bacterium]